MQEVKSANDSVPHDSTIKLLVLVFIDVYYWWQKWLAGKGRSWFELQEIYCASELDRYREKHSYFSLFIFHFISTCHASFIGKSTGSILTSFDYAIKKYNEESGWTWKAEANVCKEPVRYFFLKDDCSEIWNIHLGSTFSLRCVTDMMWNNHINSALTQTNGKHE